LYQLPNGLFVELNVSADRFEEFMSNVAHFSERRLTLVEEIAQLKDVSSLLTFVKEQLAKEGSGEAPPSVVCAVPCDPLSDPSPALAESAAVFKLADDYGDSQHPNVVLPACSALDVVSSSQSGGKVLRTQHAPPVLRGPMDTVDEHAPVGGVLPPRHSPPPSLPPSSSSSSPNLTLQHLSEVSERILSGFFSDLSSQDLGLFRFDSSQKK